MVRQDRTGDPSLRNKSQTKFNTKYFSWTCIDDRLFFFFSFDLFSLSQCSSVPLHMNIIDITNTFFFFFINSCDFKGTSLIRIPRGELLSLSPFISRKKMCQQYRKVRDPDSAHPFSPIPDIVLLNDKRTDSDSFLFFAHLFHFPPAYAVRG